jgi:predicted transcriptional regulator
MEVPLTPEQEAGLEAIKREARFVAAVKGGIASAERGDFVEHEEEVMARIERILRS